MGRPRRGAEGRVTPAPGPRARSVDVAFALWCVVALLGATLATVWLLPGA